MARQHVVPAGTRIPLVLVNSVSTKASEVGDRVYLQTAFPIFSGTRMVIPEGSYVTGTITQVKRPGMVKGRGELYLRFDTLRLRNGVFRDFRGTVSATDGSQSEIAEREGTIQAEGTKGKDLGTVAGGAIRGGTLGAVIGVAADNDAGGAIAGSAIGAGVGAAAGMVAVLLTRGNEVQLLRGTSLEMQLDRELAFYGDELVFPDHPAPSSLPGPSSVGGPVVDPSQRRNMEIPSPRPIPDPF
jgi:type IV secretion system protein VirB10